MRVTISVVTLLCASGESLVMPLTSHAQTVAEWAASVCLGWGVGMFAAYGNILAGAKIGSGPRAHPAGTWWVAIHSLILVAVLAVLIFKPARRAGSFSILVGAALGFIVPILTVFWMYSAFPVGA
jgi:hypothetical protein